MTKNEALKLALEALEEIADEVFSPYDNKLGGAILAIREALAQPETVSPGGGLVPAVPVAVYGYCPVCGGAGVMRERRPNGDDKCTNGHKYPSSKALAQPEQEPYGYFQFDLRLDAWVQNRDSNKGVAFYTTPPQRKPLTDEEIGRIAGETLDAWSCARAIEAAHGIKE